MHSREVKFAARATALGARVPLAELFIIFLRGDDPPTLFPVHQVFL